MLHRRTRGPLLLGLISMPAGLCGTAAAGAPPAETGRTSLSDSRMAYTTPRGPYVVLRRADIQAVIVDNSPVDDDVLPGHQKGYSGLASLTYRRQTRNIFVPAYAGLNFEHGHDGTVQKREVLFEPRNAPMHLRRVGEYTAELYQPPTPHYRLESCIRYELLEDGTIEMTLECIPRARAFRNGYIGLFFASYIQQPESLDIHFRGRPENTPDAPADWIRGVTPAHGRLATHRSLDDERRFPHDADFPLSLVFGFSEHRFAEPWYYGLSHEMALVFMFRPQDRVRLTQSPSGGGPGNPAWDFQWFISDYQVDHRYTFVMRTMYVPFESSEQIARDSAAHRAALAGPSTRRGP